MNTEKRFKTKAGFCHILSDKIVLTKDGIIGNISNKVTGKGVYKTLIIYSGLSIYLLYSSYNKFQNDKVVFGVLHAVLGLFLIYGVIISRNNSATSIIERSTIKETKFIKGRTGLTRSRFEVFFEENGKIKKRLIPLPGSLNNGNAETEEALRIMKEEKIITTND